ncbi:MAG TPA: tRNA uridine-5-carboxymethylaminomethyl(34) synthesis GTPase MnmE, partial [Thermodesulfovibrionales bacterium]|nr:tRNA uridine-5-carboxymethylaminomethyl(34) synthesis GTPase MnmE [Thermodesulfovibrionales bacterium]
MHALDDTIAAISTPIGQGGIGIVRLTGPKAASIADSVFRCRSGKRLSLAPSRRSIYGQVVDPADNRIVDEVLATIM